MDPRSVAKKTRFGGGPEEFTLMAFFYEKVIGMFGARRHTLKPFGCPPNSTRPAGVQGELIPAPRFRRGGPHGRRRRFGILVRRVTPTVANRNQETGFVRAVSDN